MIFTIEPMINAGKFGCRLDDEDSWTVYTADGKKSAQWNIRFWSLQLAVKS